MVKFCVLHKASMPENYSKTKVNEDGTPKAYWSHIDPDGKICFGTGKAPAGEHKQVVEQATASEDKKEDDYRYDTRKEKAYKEFNKTLGVVSSGDRGEGKSPQEAVESGHLWDWLDFFHLSDKYYEEWKDDKRENYMKLYEK